MGMHGPIIVESKVYKKWVALADDKKIMEGATFGELVDKLTLSNHFAYFAPAILEMQRILKKGIVKKKGGR
jgi:hypothetical protein